MSKRLLVFLLCLAFVGGIFLPHDSAFAAEPHTATLCTCNVHSNTKCTSTTSLTEPCDGTVSVSKWGPNLNGTCPTCGHNLYTYAFDCDGCTYGANHSATSGLWCDHCETAPSVPNPPGIGAHTVHAGYKCTIHNWSNYSQSYHYTCSYCGGTNVTYNGPCASNACDTGHEAYSGVAHYVCATHGYVGTSSTCPGGDVNCIPVQYLTWTRDTDPQYTCTGGTFSVDGPRVKLTGVSSTTYKDQTYHLYSNEFTFTEVGAISSKTYDWDDYLTRWEVTDSSGNVVFSTAGSATCELQPGTYQVHIYKTIGEKNNGTNSSYSCDMRFYILGGSTYYPLTKVYNSVIVNGLSKSFSLDLTKMDVMHIAYTFPGMTWSANCYPDCTVTITNSSGTTVGTYTYEGSADVAYQQICFTAPATDSYTVNMEVTSSYEFC